jgi:hypothetical protein
MPHCNIPGDTQGSCKQQILVVARNRNEQGSDPYRGFIIWKQVPDLLSNSQFGTFSWARNWRIRAETGVKFRSNHLRLNSLCWSGPEANPLL